VPEPDYAEGINWMLDFGQGGDYDVWAYIPSAIDDLTNGALYKVFHDGGDTTEISTVDQAGDAGSWAYLGDYSFATGANQWVRLGDNFSHASDEGTKVVFDALKLVPVGGGCECGEAGAVETQPCGDVGVQVRTCDGCWWSDWSECIGDSGDDDDDTTAGMGAQEAGDQGCSCDQDTGRTSALPALLLTIVGTAALLRGRR